ncbi:MAG: YHS domain-containing (seleno)protein [Pseudomonadota bacterium]
MRRLGFAIAATFAAFSSIVGAAFAADPVYTGRFSNVAVDGYDVVSYFSEGEPVKGDAEFETTYNGAEWRFTSAANRDAFIADPESYAPQYGGYCAWAVSQGYTAKGSPQHWRVVDDKLYLNYNAKVQRDWLADIPGFIALADANWPSVLE